MSEISRFKNPGACYREVQRIQKQIGQLHDKVFVRHVPLDVAEAMVLGALAQDPLVLSDWTMLGQIEDLTQIRDAGKILHH